MLIFIYDYIISMISNNADLILKKSNNNGNLWLGDYKSSLDANFLLKNNITFIVNCTPTSPFINDIIENKITNLETFRIPVHDSLLDNDIFLMEKYFHIIIPILFHKLIHEKCNILIHCKAGKQRSGILTLAFIYQLLYTQTLILSEIPFTKNKKELINNIIKYLLQKRPCVFTYGYRINFQKAIEKYIGVDIV